MNPPPLWQLWRNPIVRRYAVSRLRPIALFGWGLPVHALGAFLWLVTYLYSHRQAGAAVEHAATLAWIYILALQGVLWIMKGTFSVAVGIAREGAEGLTDAQRLTPLPPAYKVLGYLFGLPILETVLVASLLPWSIVSMALAKIPLLIAFRVYLLLVTAAILHHAIGLVTGTVIRQKIVAGTVSQILVVVLHLVVPLFARLGAGPLGHLGVETAISREISPLLGKADLVSHVRFFQYSLTLTGFQWVIMATLLAFLLSILWRKWQREDAHLFSKPLALVFLSWVFVMSLGEICPHIADGTLLRFGRDFSVGGMNFTDEVGQRGLTIAWAAAFGVVALIIAMLVASMITPTLDQYWRAQRALQAQGSRRLAWTSDAASALGWVVALGLCTAASWRCVVDQTMATPLVAFILHPASSLPFMLAGGLLLPLLVWSALLEWRGQKMAYAAAFAFWIIPLMIVIVAMLSGVSITGWPRWFLSLSGFALPALSLFQALTGLSRLGDSFTALHAPWVLSLWIQSGLAIVFYCALRKAQRSEDKESALRNARVVSRLAEPVAIAN